MREGIIIDSGLEMIVSMAEGNPGAATVMGQMLKLDRDNILHIISLDDMNIRGQQVWVGYKDHCEENMDKFIEAIKARDSEMVDTINKNCIYQSEYGSFTERAVCNGASFNR